jgi:hypothetical protein
VTNKNVVPKTTPVDTNIGVITNTALVNHKKQVVNSDYTTSYKTAHAYHHNTADGGLSWKSTTSYIDASEVNNLSNNNAHVNDAKPPTLAGNV